MPFRGHGGAYYHVVSYTLFEVYDDVKEAGCRMEARMEVMGDGWVACL